MDLKEFYFKNIQESEYHYRFHDSIKNVNMLHNSWFGYEEVDDYEFKVYDSEEAITKFRELCQPEENFSSSEKKCWFYLITYYLYKMGYEIKEFPRVLARPPVNPNDFTYGEIRNRIIAHGDDENGTVRYAVRRKFIASFTFELKDSHIDIDNLINQKFVEISNRQASFNNMRIDEKLAEIANLIENLLKKNGKFVTPDYSRICFDYISNDIVTSYRKKMHCFRHATDEAIAERNSYSEEQKNFFVDYGLTIVKVIYSLLK
ncbi:hypothetical protein JJB67_12255 [Clostridium perfringens]|nr:hypothetical protein [Clostridium perfringens]MBO3323094.1 hypothetical protein [Clostridium perfringens]MBO3332258.1 hypothetical protein [Clostridium perfringens]WFD87864.1 hypothetical protein P7C84_00905 [Clostridium perfringens]HAT4317686.1 hypothetical protein [Clostridium perfringens]